MDHYAQEVVDWEAKYNAKKQWHDEDLGYWYRSLVEEFLELTLSLDGKHEHPPEVELKQIGAIAIGMRRHIDRLNGVLVDAP